MKKLLLCLIALALSSCSGPEYEGHPLVGVWSFAYATEYVYADGTGKEVDSSNCTTHFTWSPESYANKGFANLTVTGSSCWNASISTWRIYYVRSGNTLTIYWL